MNRPHPRRARVLTLQALYQLDSGRPWEDLASFFGEPGDPTAELARSLTRGAWEHREDLDGILQEHLREWSVARLGLVERAVLRLALYELAHRCEVPVAVVIDEAVELAKRFAGDRAAALINAVLDKAKVVRDERSQGC